MADTNETQAIQLFSVTCTECGEESWYPAVPDGIDMALCGECMAALQNAETTPEPVYR